MAKIKKDIQTAFLTLVRSGLWEQDVQIKQFEKIDYSEVCRLAEEQSVVGIIAAGLEHVLDTKLNRDFALAIVGNTLQLEQRNIAMDEFVAKLIGLLRCHEVYALLLKGQGVAQCYERPLWRTCGDVDLFLSEKNYVNAKKILVPLASKLDEENGYNQHLALTIDSWCVELHGSLRGGLWKKAERVLDKVQSAIFCEGKVRSWQNGQTQVFLPHVDEDAIYVFYHILQHFYYEGIGLRQICDWCRLLWKYRGTINLKLLESRIREMGIMSEWKAFASVAVGTLGMPVEAMPFYSSEKKWQKKAEKILCFVIETGNFGHNRDYSYYEKYPYVFIKVISFWRHVMDTFKYFSVFPWDSLKVLRLKMNFGIKIIIHQNKTK